MTALELRGVAKKYAATPVLRDINLTMNDGETLVVVGSSGCGKSTMLRAIAGLTDIDAGSITVRGTVVSGPTTFVPPEKRAIGLVFQDLVLFPHLTVADNVAFGITTRQRRAVPVDTFRLTDILDAVGLTDKARRFPHELSGGEQQRVAIARALAINPELVLLDEPFSHLDRGLAANIRHEAMNILRQAGASVVLVTHDHTEALAVADQVAVMRAGMIEQVGTPKQVFHTPINEFVATFLGEADFVDGQRNGPNTAITPLGTVTVTPGEDKYVQVMVRPHDLTIRDAMRSSPSSTEEDHGVSGVIVDYEFRGGFVAHRVQLADGGYIVRALTDHTTVYRPGSDVLVQMSTGHPLATTVTTTST